MPLPFAPAFCPFVFDLALPISTRKQKEISDFLEQEQSKAFVTARIPASRFPFSSFSETPSLIYTLLHTLVLTASSKLPSTPSLLCPALLPFLTLHTILSQLTAFISVFSFSFPSLPALLLLLIR